MLAPQKPQFLTSHGDLYLTVVFRLNFANLYILQRCVILNSKAQGDREVIVLLREIRRVDSIYIRAQNLGKSFFLDKQRQKHQI